jgi:flagellar motor switch protein FliN/FliY
MSEEIISPEVENEAMQAQVQQAAIADAQMVENMETEQAPLDNLINDAVPPPGEDNLNTILDIPISLSVEIGQTKISIRNLLQLNQGSVVELDRLAGESLDVMVNNTLVAHGEIVVINEKYGIRLTDVISALERVKNLQ